MKIPWTKPHGLRQASFRLTDTLIYRNIVHQRGLKQQRVAAIKVRQMIIRVNGDRLFKFFLCCAQELDLFFA